MLAAVISLATVTGSAQEPITIRREFHDNGTPRVLAEYRNGVRHGVYRTWYPSGRPYEERHYLDGREEGLQRSWTEDGELYLNYEMRDGRRYGFVNAKPCLPVDGQS